MDSYGRTKFRSSDIHGVILDFVNMSFCSCNCVGSVETSVEVNGGEK